MNNPVLHFEQIDFKRSRRKTNFTRQANMLQQNQWWNPFKCVWNARSPWNFGVTDKQLTEPGPWERVRQEESQKVASMSISQVFDYIQLIVNSDSDWKIEAHHKWIMFHNLRSEEIFRVSGLSAAAEYKQTIIFILAELKSRLAGKTKLKKGNR